MLKVLKNNVLIEENSSEMVSSSGIILDGANSVKDSKTFTVRAIGSTVTEVEVGSVVYIDWNKVKPIKYEGKLTFAIISEEDITCVVED